MYSVTDERTDGRTEGIAVAYNMLACNVSCDKIQGGVKTDHFQKCITPIYDDVGRRSIYQNVQLFIRSKTDILNFAIFKCISSEKRYYTPKIQINLATIFESILSRVYDDAKR